jgi:ATP-dependent exoDNAse (exonuclease V) beta subunit
LKTAAFSIYDASAGSGKTFTLVKEYLKIILTSSKDDAYKSILAITFTNKAVGEMKSRIVDTLSDLASDSPSEKAITVANAIALETDLSLDRIFQKSKIILRTIIHNYAAFDISTIDKFTHRVIRTFAHDLNLPSTFEVSLETQNLLNEAVDAIVAEAGNDEVLTKLLVDFTIEKADDDKSWDVTRDILEISKLLTNENNRTEIEHYKEKELEEFVALKKKLQQTCKQLEHEVMDLAQNAMRLIHDHHLDAKAFTRGTVYNYFSKHSQGDFEPKSNVESALSEENRYAKTVPTAQKQAVDNIAPELLSMYFIMLEKKQNLLFYASFLKNITPMSLLNKVSQQLHKIQEEQNILSIAEFNAIIHQEIQNQPAPFIYERMGERYKHFFIDEFQDTSQMQWENLIPLIDNALSSEDLNQERGSLMIVGDPKQSIYRWRGGKAEQFIALGKDKNPFHNPDKALYFLDTNWRSYSQIIDFNNRFFHFVSRYFSHPDYKELYEKHSFQKENHKKGGYVRFSFLPRPSEMEEEETKSDLYLAEVLKTIHQLTEKGFSYRDMVILTRKKDPGVEIAKYLTENSIPIVSSESLLLLNSTKVMFIIHFLRYLNNAANVDSKANMLYFIATHSQDKFPTHDFIATGLAFENEEELENWLLDFSLSFSLKKLRKMPLYETVESIIRTFIPIEQLDVYVQDLLDRVLERSVRSQNSIADFLYFWDTQSHKFSIPSPDGNNAIRIMTIHKSKGLEFPVVIFPFAEESYSSAPKDKLWVEHEDESISIPKVLIDNKQEVLNYGESATAVYLQKKEEELLDNINVLYVALTRAEEQLHVISRMNLTNKDEIVKSNMTTFFLQFLEDIGEFNTQKLVYEWGSPERISVESKKTKQTKIIPAIQASLPIDAIKIAKRESQMWGSKTKEAIEYGNVIHAIAAQIKSHLDVDIAIEKALEDGLISLLQKEIVSSVIKDLVAHPEIKMFFEENDKIWNEQTILRKGTSAIKPDRIVLQSDNKAMLLDYKTGKPEPKHHQQLAEYEATLNEMGFEVIKKTLVYLGDKVEIVNL